MVKRRSKSFNFGVGNPIENRSAQLSMLFFGIILVFAGIFSDSLNIFFSVNDITNFFNLFLGLFAAILAFIELRFKVFGNWNRQLKRFGAQQWLTFGVAILVVLSSILVTFFPFFSFLTLFNNVTFIVTGLLIILEAFI